MSILNNFKHITIKNISARDEENSKYRNKNHLVSLLHDWYYDNDPEHKETVESYIKFLNSIMDKTKEIQEKLNIPYIDYGYVILELLSQEEYSTNINDFFPISLYISAGGESEDEHGYDDYTSTIGIRVTEQGKVLEISEGNDEASPKTIALVNKLINPNPKLVRIYAAHDRKLSFKIHMNDILPKGLFVSPKLEVAKGYMDLKGERELFTGLIDIRDINQTSDIDWVTLEPTKIHKFRFM